MAFAHYDSALVGAESFVVKSVRICGESTVVPATKFPTFRRFKFDNIFTTWKVVDLEVARFVYANGEGRKWERAGNVIWLIPSARVQPLVVDDGPKLIRDQNLRCFAILGLNLIF